jgi:integrase
MDKRPTTLTHRRRRNGQGSVSSKPNGKGYYTLTITRNYRKKVMYFRTQREAEAKRKELVNQPLVNLGPEMSVGDALTLWLKEAYGTIKPSTLASYQGLTRTHLMPELGHIKLAKLDPSQIHAMMVDATKGTRKHAGVSNRTANHLRTVLGTALNFAMARRWVMWNPAMVTRPLTVEHFEAYAMTERERERFEKAIEGHRLEALYLMALGMGLREGELLALTRGDLDFAALTLTVRKNLRDGTRADPKTKHSRRVLPLIPFFVGRLDAHLARQKVTSLDGLLFATSNGTPFTARNLIRDFKKVLVKAGLPQVIRFHDLRHATASFLAAKGVEPAVAQAILGHSDIRTTLQVYTHTTEARMREGLQAINR